MIFIVINVCRFLLKDASVPWIIRIRRGMALLLLGEIFSEVGMKCGERTAVGRELVETAMIGVLTRESQRQGQEQGETHPTYFYSNPSATEAGGARQQEQY